MHRIFVTALLLVGLALRGVATNYVVCVGIADYPGTRNDLKVSANDARTIASIYEKNGYSEVRVLLNQQATRQSVLSQMNNLFGKATEDDCIILYFSGHGMPGSLACYDGLLLYSKIVEVMKQSRAKSKVVMADACFSGRMRQGKQRGDKYSSQDVMFFLSSRSSEPSLETRFSNSLFTIFLERGLRGGADINKDRTITARELYDFVHNGVVEATKDKQHPVMWGNFSDDMPVISWK